MKRLLCTVGFALLVGFPAHSEEGRIPIFQPVFIDGSAGQAIGGRYVLTRDITGTSPNEPVIKIVGNGSQHVDLDLNGFTVTAVDASREAVFADSLAAFRLHNGAVVSNSTQNYWAIRVGSASGLQIVSVSIERLTIVGGMLDGVAVNRALNIGIANNTILDSGRHGIRIAGDTAIGKNSHATIEETVIRGSAQHGMIVQEGVSSVVVRDNQLEANAHNGIHAGSSGSVRIERNTVEGSGKNGIFLNNTQACSVSANVIHGSVTESGIWISTMASGCVVSGNSVGGSQVGAGIRVTGARNQILDNVVTNNMGYGLLLDPGAVGNTLGHNTARGNMGAGLNCMPRCPGLAEPDFCDQGPLSNKNTSFGDNLAPGGDPGSPEGDGPC